MRSFSFRRTEKSSQDEARMLTIIKNVLEHKKSPYEIKLKGLCRVSFKSTYGEIFQGDFEKLWGKVVKNSL